MTEVEIHNISSLNLKTHDLERIDHFSFICGKCGKYFNLYYQEYGRNKHGHLKDLIKQHFSTDYDLSCEEEMIKNIIE